MSEHAELVGGLNPAPVDSQIEVVPALSLATGDAPGDNSFSAVQEVPYGLAMGYSIVVVLRHQPVDRIPVLHVQ